MTTQREAFEKWITDTHTNSCRSRGMMETKEHESLVESVNKYMVQKYQSDNSYYCDETNEKWEAWQAALPQPNELAIVSKESIKIQARLPNGVCVSNVYEAYEAGLKDALSQPNEPVMSEFDKFHKEAFETRIKQLEINNVKLVEALTLADKLLGLIMIDEAYHEERANIDTIYTMRNDSFKLTKAAIPTINLKLTGE